MSDDKNYLDTQLSDALKVLDDNRKIATFEFPVNTRFKLIKRIIRRLIRVSIFKQQYFNDSVFETISTLKAYINEADKQNADKENKINEINNMYVNKINEINNMYVNKINEINKQNLYLQSLIETNSSKIVDQQNEIQRISDILKDAGYYEPKDDKLSWGRRSTSQAGEDLILEFLFAMLHIPINKCDYIDLGANHPYYLSNTNFFYQNGAKGVLVEANPNLINDLKFYRNRDIILNRFVSSKSGEKIDFYVTNIDGLSTSNYYSAQENMKENPELKINAKIQVESITVNEIMDSYLGYAPKILNIDLEGMELDVVKSIDFAKYRPLVIIMEMIPYKTSLVIEGKNESIIDFMQEVGYTEYAFTGINSIFIDKSQVNRLKQINVGLEVD